jgi:hypothetical protein
VTLTEAESAWAAVGTRAGSASAIAATAGIVVAKGILGVIHHYLAHRESL